MRARPYAFFAALFLAAASCTSANSAPADSTAPAVIDLGPSPTAISEERLASFEDFDSATRLFDEEKAASTAEVRRYADDGASEATVDAVIRREAARLIRVTDAIYQESERQFQEFLRECQCMVSRSSFMGWVHEKLVEVNAWVRAMESDHLESPRPRGLSTEDDILTALLPLVEGIEGGGPHAEGTEHEPFSSGGEGGFAALLLSNVESADPFSVADRLSSVDSRVWGFRANWTSLRVDVSPVWKINQAAFALLVTELESGRPAEEYGLLRTYLESVLARDAQAYDDIGSTTPEVDYALAAEAAVRLETLTPAEREAIARTGASLLIHNEVAAISAQLRDLREAGSGREKLAQARQTVAESEYFDAESVGHAALLRAMDELDADLAAAAGAQDADIEAAITEAVANRLVAQASEGGLATGTRNLLITDAVALDLRDGNISTGVDGPLVFGPESFLHSRRFSDYSFAFFPELTRVVRENEESLSSAATAAPLP